MCVCMCVCSNVSVELRCKAFRKGRCPFIIRTISKTFLPKEVYKITSRGRMPLFKAYLSCPKGQEVVLF